MCTLYHFRSKHAKSLVFIIIERRKKREYQLTLPYFPFMRLGSVSVRLRMNTKVKIRHFSTALDSLVKSKSKISIRDIETEIGKLCDTTECRNIFYLYISRKVI